MKNKSNINLFWYGLFANMKIFLGVVTFFGGLIIGFTKLFLGIVIVLIGALIILWGRSQRFDYQQQSGTMIHRGDW